MNKELKIQPWQLQQRQSMPLWMKVEYSKKRIIAWYEFYEGQVYVAYSGGKDSEVLLSLTRSIYPEVPGVFCDTGLEYPEIRKHIMGKENIIIVKPTIRFDEVISKYGYPVISKMTARMISDFQNSTGNNKDELNLYLTGKTKNGTPCPSKKLANKWHKLINAPFKISHKCCYFLKKQPSYLYEKETGRKPLLGIMATESKLRNSQYLKQGCNAYDNKRPTCMPIAFWKTEDIWEYLKTNNISYCSIYDKGETQTGCIFCMFGVHMDGIPNRFQRLKSLHPKLYNYCINDLGIGGVLDYINVPYGDFENKQQQVMEF